MSDDEIIAMFHAMFEEAMADCEQQGRLIVTNASQLSNDEQVEAIVENMAKKTGENPERLFMVLKKGRELVLPHVQDKSSIIRVGIPKIITPPWFHRD